MGASWKLPHGCKGGNCGLCKARLVSGEVHYPNGRPVGLSEAEIGSGYILLCQARARSELELELNEIRPAHDRKDILQGMDRALQRILKRVRG